MRIVGLDLSLTATGICDEYRGARVYKSKHRGCARLADLRDHIYTIVDDDRLVVLEGYSYASANQAHQLGELGGVIRLAITETGAPYVDVPPSTLKKFATGKGNANKAAMGLAAARAGYDGPGDDNAIDAWWLMQMGVYATNDRWAVTAPGVVLAQHAYRDEAITKIEWPAA